MTSQFTIADGKMYGEWRQPLNIGAASKGSIHDDETARKVGMRGGTVHGTVHLNLFPPLMVELWGQRWFERGTISMYYTYATTDREAVRAVVALPPAGAKDAQVEAWVENEAGQTVAKGTVSVGVPDSPSYLRTMELTNAPPEELRILAGLQAGSVLPSRDLLVPPEMVQQDRQQIADRIVRYIKTGLDVLTDPLDWYTGPSPWGPPVLWPDATWGAMMVGVTRPDGQPVRGVGFFGATEIRHLAGPIKMGVPYRVSGKLVCVGASAKTEYYWYEAYLDERDSGTRVAEILHMLRYMKAGSPFYLAGQRA